LRAMCSIEWASPSRRCVSRRALTLAAIHVHPRHVSSVEYGVDSRVKLGGCPLSRSDQIEGPCAARQGR
jgi:hypothetical protein